MEHMILITARSKHQEFLNVGNAQLVSLSVSYVLRVTLILVLLNHLNYTQLR